MTLIVADRVKETTTTTGTGAVTLAGAATGYRAFSSVCADGDTVGYCIEGGSEWETGVGTFTLSGTTLARTNVIASSNSNNAVNFSAGTKNVFCTLLGRQTQRLVRHPDTPPPIPNAADDDWLGTALDTSGTRISGATAWTWYRQGTSSITVGDGRSIITLQVDNSLRGISQAVPGTTWKIRAKISQAGDATTSIGCGLFVYNSSSTVAHLFGPIGCYLSKWTNGAYSADIVGASFNSPVTWAGYLEIENDNTNLYFRASPTGAEGSFVKISSYGNTANGLSAAPTSYGIAGFTNTSGRIVCEWFRRIS